MLRNPTERLVTAICVGFVAACAAGSAVSTAGTVPPARRIEPKSGLEFVLQPPGRFHLGCEPQDTLCTDREQPGRMATVTGLWLGATEVTVAAWLRCVEVGACPALQTAGQCNSAARPKDPVNCIDWSEAKAFCSWIGGRLPTAEEWEYAAKSGESRIFPWGNAPPDPSKAHFDSTETAPVATHRAGDTKWGLSDMAGNVWEWTASDFDDAHKEVRGGGRFLFPKGLRASSRGTAEPGERSGGIGLRCRL